MWIASSAARKAHAGNPGVAGAFGHRDDPAVDASESGITLEHYYSPWEVERAVAHFVEDDNHRRYHEALQNVTPAHVWHGRQAAILARRARASNSGRCSNGNARIYRRRMTRPFARKCLYKTGLNGPTSADDVHR
jgi:hypothetical protein